MLGNWQILKIETFQMVGWFYAGQLADSENRNISDGWMVICWAAGRFWKQKHIRCLDGSMLGNWQILKTETYQVVGWFYARATGRF